MSKQEHTDEELLAVILKALHATNMENAIQGEPCHSLAGQLQSRTAEHLRKLAKLYHVPGYSKMNKAALAQAMAEWMAQPQVARHILAAPDKNGWEFFKAAVAVDRYQDERMTPDMYYGLQNVCLLQLYTHVGEVYVVVPDELKQAFFLLKQEGFVEEQDHKVLLLAYAKAAVSLYGVISMDDFVKLFNHQNKRKTDVDEMFEVLIQYVTESSDFCFWEDYLVNSSMEEGDFKDVKRYLRYSKGKPRYIPPQEEFLGYAYFEYTPEMEALRDYLTEFINKDEDAAEDFVEDVFYTCATELPDASLTDALTAILEEHGLELGASTFDLYKLMIDASNHIRRWVNNGFTPHELAQRYGSPAGLPARKKAGPNDPCPCGSGKKHKKCCMFK